MVRSLALVLIAVLALPALAQPAAGDLVVNEVMYDPPAPQPSANEWVEVLNVSGRTLDLGGLVVTDGTGTSDPVPAGTLLTDGDYLVLTRDGAAFAAAYPGVTFVDLDGFPALNNSGDRPALVLGATEIDAVPYLPAWGGTDASLERRDPLGPSDQASNFGTTTAASGGTPGAQNSLFAADQQPPAVVSAEALDAQTIRVVFDEPVEETSAETAANYSIGSGVGIPLMADRGAGGAEVILALAAPLTGRQTYTVTVSGVADLRGNVLTSGTASFFFGQGDAADPRDLVLNEFLYDEPATDNPGEFVELFNRTDKSFDLRQFTLNDGTGDDQPVTDQAVFVEPGGYAVIVEDGALFQAVFPGIAFVEQPAWSALNNTGDAIVLKYQGTTIDALTYTPDWGGEDASLERKDPEGPSSTSANWATTTDLRGGTPGAINSQFAPDVTGPQLVRATVSRDGQTLTVTLDEPADPASVTASAFAVTGASVATASYTAGAQTVVLGLSNALAAGTTTITASGLVDLLGNTTASTSTTVEFTPDTSAPQIARASARGVSTVRVEFTEPITVASATAAYAIDGIGTASSATVVLERDGGALSVDVAFASPLADQTLYTIKAQSLTDLAGNATPTASARFFVGQPDTPAPGDVVVTEIMYDPQNGANGEYIELLNTSADRIFDLRAITLDDGDGDGDPLADEPTVLLPGEYLAVARNADGFRAVFPEAPFTEAGSVIGLSNSGEAVVLRAAGAVLDSVSYDPDWHRVELDDATGISLERRDAAGPANSASNWSSSLADLGGTPSAPNSLSISGTPVARDPELSITSPFAPTLGEAARITVTLSTEAGLIRARVFDGGGRVVRELEPGRLIGGTGTLVWDGTGDDRRPLRAGIYIVLVEAVDAEGGTTEAVRGAVVLARP